MVRSQAKFPEVGELVVAHVEDVQPSYVYVRLEDFQGNRSGSNARGMIHISEIASHWVRNIHDFIKENTKVVLKVLRVDERKGHVDLSLRRVKAQQKKEKIKSWKRAVKSENLLQILAETHDVPLDEVMERVGFPMAVGFDDLLGSFEAVKEAQENDETGMKVLEEYDMPDEWRKTLFDLIEQNVEIRRVKITGEFQIVVPTSEGVESVKDALLAGLAIKHDPSLSVKITTIGAPRYQLTIGAKNYLDAEDLYSEIEVAVREPIEAAGGTCSLERTD